MKCAVRPRKWQGSKELDKGGSANCLHHPSLCSHVLLIACPREEFVYFDLTSEQMPAGDVTDSDFHKIGFRRTPVKPTIARERSFDGRLLEMTENRIIYSEYEFWTFWKTKILVRLSLEWYINKKNNKNYANFENTLKWIVLLLKEKSIKHANHTTNYFLKYECLHDTIEK